MLKSSLDPLFAPLALRELRLANRFMMAPMTRSFSPDGVPGENVSRYYRRRAEGGVGLIVTEGTGIDHPAAIGVSSRGQDIPLMHGEASMAGWKHVVEEVHSAGGKIAPQLWHMGPFRPPNTGPFPDAPVCRPSGIWGPINRHCAITEESKESYASPSAPMSESQIADVIAAFSRSAANAKSVGFDGIAIHGAHGYLIDSFFWDETNRRNDAYGGNRRNRARFGAEVVAAIRSEIGPHMAIIFRYSQWKQQDFNARIANSPRELEDILTPLADAGVDLFDVSTRVFSAPAFEGSDLTLAGWTKKVTGVPTAAVGGIGLIKDFYSSLEGGVTASFDNLNEVILRFEAGEFDMVALGRSLLADPAWPETARAGRPFKPFQPDLLSELR